MSSTIPVYPDLPETGFLRISQVLRFVPVGRSTWWRWCANGKAPKPIKLGPKTSVWKAEDVRQLLADLENGTEH